MPDHEAKRVNSDESTHIPGLVDAFHDWQRLDDCTVLTHCVKCGAIVVLNLVELLVEEAETCPREPD
jgi:hypothetical protein